jgi:hypothetical protein
MSTVSDILGEGTVSFVIPVGDYAPLKLTLSHATLALSIVRCTIDAVLPAGAIVEVWLLKTAGNPAVDADYMLAFTLLSGSLLFQASSIYARAFQLRAKGAAAGGTVNCHALTV